MEESFSQKAKKTLVAYVSQIDKKLANYWDNEMAANFGFNERQKMVVREMLLHAKEHNLRPAKRARGAFVNFAYELSGKKADERVWRAAMGVELVHTALLMHDDFMDRDEVRRGGPTTQKFYEAKGGGDKHYGESMAVSIGDAVLCLGYQPLLDCGFPTNTVKLAMDQMLSGITQTAYGQAYDVTLEVMRNWTEDDVIALHRAKTGIYTYENPLLIGAILAGLADEVKAVLVDYAMDGGVAFQLQDDILGVFGSEDDTGKSADSDLKQGKCTLLVLKALETGSEAQKKAVEAVWGEMEAGRAELDLAKKAIEESGALEYNRKLAKEYAGKAAVTAGKLRGLGSAVPAVDYIQGIAEYMVERKV
ncbi:MAG: polyprenyl synthetase family protein [Patescibacteria group bacterium]